MSELMVNKQGQLVRRHAPHATRPAIDRFNEMTVEVTANDLDGESCLIWTGSKLFRVNDDQVTTPQRFIYEHHSGFEVGKSWKVKAVCGTKGCCRFSHLTKTPINSKQNNKAVNMP